MDQDHVGDYISNMPTVCYPALASTQIVQNAGDFWPLCRSSTGAYTSTSVPEIEYYGMTDVELGLVDAQEKTQQSQSIVPRDVSHVEADTIYFGPGISVQYEHPIAEHAGTIPNNPTGNSVATVQIQNRALARPRRRRALESMERQEVAMTRSVGCCRACRTLRVKVRFKVCLLLAYLQYPAYVWYRRRVNAY